MSRKLPVGENVILIALPPGFLDDLPEEDQRGIRAMIGKPVMLVGYDEDGRAELYFADPFMSNNTHTIWVKPELIARCRR